MQDFAEGNTKDWNIEYLFTELAEIKKEFPLLRNLACHKSIRTGDHFWDLVLEMEFDSFEDLEKYQVYPRHAALHAFAVKVRQDRAVVDYLID
jgi:hypothetical protein